MPTTIQHTQRRLVPLLIGICLLAVIPTNAHAQSLNEESLKAGYILRFIDFIRWERPASNPSTIGVLNDASLYRELSSIAAKKSNATQSFKIVQIEAATENLEGFDMIYVGPDKRQSWQEIIERSRKGSVITVSSEPGFLEAGGLLEFITLQNRLRFSLNLPEVESYNLGVSSKLAHLSVK